MNSDEIKKLSETALRMLEEVQYHEDLKELESLEPVMDVIGEMTEDEVDRLEIILKRIDQYEDKYCPIGGA